MVVLVISATVGSIATVIWIKKLIKERSQQMRGNFGQILLRLFLTLISYFSSMGKETWGSWRWWFAQSGIERGKRLWKCLIFLFFYFAITQMFEWTKFFICLKYNYLKLSSVWQQLSWCFQNLDWQVQSTDVLHF